MSNLLAMRNNRLSPGVSRRSLLLACSRHDADIPVFISKGYLNGTRYGYQVIYRMHVYGVHVHHVGVSVLTALFNDSQRMLYYARARPLTSISAGRKPKASIFSALAATSSQVKSIA